jgi:hypothetical protein
MATSIPVPNTQEALHTLPRPELGHLRDVAEGGGGDDIAESPGMTSTPAVHETLLAADGAVGLVGPVSGAQEMPNAAKPGTP